MKFHLSGVQKKFQPLKREDIIDKINLSVVGARVFLDQ